MLSEKTKIQILELQKLYPVKRSALIPAMHLAQAEHGYLSSEVQVELAELFNIAVNEVYSLITFYDMFYDKAVGKHIIHVCKNVSCMLRGSDPLLEHLCEKLKIKAGETTADGKFTVIASECLAACDRAPMMLVDDKVFGPVAVQDLDDILHEADKSSGHPCPIPVMEASHG